MSDTIPVKLPKNTITVHFPVMDVNGAEIWEDRILSDGDTRILSDGDTRTVAGDVVYPEVVKIKIRNAIIPVHLED